MRTLALLLISIPLGGCFVDQACASRPNDPFCQQLDSGLPPTDTNGGGVDMGMIACVPSCAGSQICNTATGFCVDCIDNTNCTSPTAALCDTTAHTCGACTQNQDCSHLSATPACHVGTCVQCNTNDDCDATHGCDHTTHTCMSITPGSAMLCQACLRDSQCMSGQLCVPMTFGGTSVGSFCAWRSDATATGGPMGDCRNVRPMVSPSTLTSVDNVSAMVCLLAVSTCAAHAAFRNGCTTVTGTMSSAECAPNMDGYCQMQGALPSECTVGCSNSIDCPCVTGTCMNQFSCASGFCDLSTTQTCTWDAMHHTCH